MTFGTIAVVGLGYIGLPTAAVFASRKRKVIGIDVNTDAVETINRGEVHIVEPDLDMLVHAAVTEGYLRATTVAEPADAFLIAVPTPFKTNHEPDGFVKVIAEAESDKVLGVWAIAVPAGTMIAEAALGMEFGATSEDIAYTCHAHPTHSEAIKEAAMAVQGKPIHI